ncbi:MAG TPA: DUF3108 domain-containing protein [Pyrinomonadaceae bacterium]|nr:DUF3108 domain-containing protein [Pyrinomonadaceae bacterium]
MKLTQSQTSNLKDRTALFKNFTLVCLVIFLGAAAFFALKGVSAQTLEKTENLSPTPFRVGEKLTYTVSFGRYKNAGFAEIYVVSRGKIDGKDAIELHSKFKTNELVSAAFYLLDESRTTFAAADSGLPLYIRKTSNAGVAPQETINNFLTVPTQNFDLLTLVYRLRNAGGAGSFLLQEDEKNYSVTAQTTVTERVKTDIGDFETTVSTVQSEYFTEKGFKDFRVNFSTNEQKIPVSVRFKTSKGEFQALLASVQMIEPEVENQPTPTPTPTPVPVLTPTPVPTPTPSLDNQPLSSNLPFVLGETLEYKITTNNQNVGTFLLQAKERRTIDKKDVLFLEAKVSKTERGFGIFNVGDSINAQVNAESLTPYQFEVRFTGTLSSFNQAARFDQERGFAIFDGTNQAQIPLNTHSLLSLIYAVRSFNLKPSKDTKNPVNDTRVSVFYGSQFYVFTLRPFDTEVINMNGEKVPAQMITVITQNPQLDALNLKIWLSNNEKRTPLRFAIGGYQADLVSEKVIQPK